MRYYDPNIGRWLSPDPSEEFPSPYIYCGNNPINLIDPNGESTITDTSGNVIEVYDDGDLGVYREVEGGGLMYMGETEFWDEFIDPETNNVGGKILFEESWDIIIEELHNVSTAMNLVEIAQNSRPGKKFDIKASNPMEGRLLEDKYATARSAGNYLAAYNARYGTLLGTHISYTTFVKLAGALHQGQFNYINAAKIVIFGTSYGSPPWYGEIGYAGRMFPMGWNRRK